MPAHPLRLVEDRTNDSDPTAASPGPADEADAPEVTDEGSDGGSFVFGFLVCVIFLGFGAYGLTQPEEHATLVLDPQVTARVFTESGFDDLVPDVCVELLQDGETILPATFLFEDNGIRWLEFSGASANSGQLLAVVQEQRDQRRLVLLYDKQTQEAFRCLREDEEAALDVDLQAAWQARLGQFFNENPSVTLPR